MILVTGGCGFIGSHTVRGLIEEGYEAIAFDIVKPSPLPLPLIEVADKIKFVIGDITQFASLHKVFNTYDVDYVIHLAWLMGGSKGAAIKAIKVNVEGTCNVLDLARLKNVNRVVFASSEDVYGSAALHPKPVVEDAPLWPEARKDNLIYASTKAMGEYLCRHYNSAFGLDFTAFRFGTVYGYGQRNAWVVDFFEKPIRGIPYKSEKKAENKYNFLYVKDLVNAIQLALKIKDPKHQIFNVRGEVHTIKDLANIVKKFIPSAVIDIQPGKDPNLSPPTMDITRAKSRLGYKNKYTLEDGACEYIDQLRS